MLSAAVATVDARADGDEATREAGAAYDEGARAYDAKDYATAARRFAVADEKVPSGRALELAMASALLANDAPLGMDLVVRAERRSVDGSLAQLAAKLKKRFSEAVGSVALVCAEGRPCRADLEGRALAPGLPRHALPGAHAIVITSDDGASATVEVMVARGSTATARAKGVVAAPPSPPSEERPAPPPLRADRGLSPVYFGVAAGMTAVAIGTAIGLTVRTGALHEEFRTSPSQASADAGDDAQTAARIVWGASGALAVASAVLFVLTDFRGGTGPNVAFGPGSVGIVGEF